LGIKTAELNEIIANSLSDTLKFAKMIDLNIGEPEDILTRANHEIFNTYMSILKLFKERQELTRNILKEERQKGISEAKTIAISTLSHYINNSSMIISGQSQILRLMLAKKSPDEVIAALKKGLGLIDNAVKKTVAVLEEISELNMLDDVEFFDQSKILNIDDRINERLEKLKDTSVYHRINTLD
jgi:signal transduction histidine kinase